MDYFRGSLKIRLQVSLIRSIMTCATILILMHCWIESPLSIKILHVHLKMIQLHKIIFFSPDCCFYMSKLRTILLIMIFLITNPTSFHHVHWTLVQTMLLYVFMDFLIELLSSLALLAVFKRFDLISSINQGWFPHGTLRGPSSSTCLF